MHGQVGCLSCYDAPLYKPYASFYKPYLLWCCWLVDCVTPVLLLNALKKKSCRCAVRVYRLIQHVDSCLLHHLHHGQSMLMLLFL